MAQHTERLWTQTKDTEQLTFVAGVDLPFRELVKESAPSITILLAVDNPAGFQLLISDPRIVTGKQIGRAHV